jgi:hypothetical protein
MAPIVQIDLEEKSVLLDSGDVASVANPVLETSEFAFRVSISTLNT